MLKMITCSPGSIPPLRAQSALDPDQHALPRPHHLPSQQALQVRFFYAFPYKIREFVYGWALFVGVCSTFRKGYFSFELLKSTDDKCEENFHFV